ncbi:MAG: DUF2924 domain-containing protein [Planctomycetota bacterium]
MNTISEQFRELQTLTPAELSVRYEDLFGKPPRVRNKAFLQRKVAWKLQEREFGGLSDRAKARLEELIQQIDLPLPPPEPKRRSARRNAGAQPPLVGTTLTRRWHDQDIRVEARDNGFEWNGTLYRSLSAVARAITGAHWNGKLFFGLKTRRKTS